MVFPHTVGYGLRMSASFLAKLLPAVEKEHDGEASLDNHEIDETNTEHIIAMKIKMWTILKMEQRLWKRI